MKHVTFEPNGGMYSLRSCHRENLIRIWKTAQLL